MFFGKLKAKGLFSIFLYLDFSHSFAFIIMFFFNSVKYYVMLKGTVVHSLIINDVKYTVLYLCPFA